MTSKLIAIILTFGVIGCVLLVNRQQRIEAAHEMSLIHRRMTDHERTMWRLRADIAQKCSPEELRLASKKLQEEWKPIFHNTRNDSFTRDETSENEGVDE